MLNFKNNNNIITILSSITGKSFEISISFFSSSEKDSLSSFSENISVKH